MSIACWITLQHGRINFISTSIDDDTTKHQHNHGNGNTTQQSARTTTIQIRPYKYSSSWSSSQLTLLTNDDDGTDGSSNMVWWWCFAFTNDGILVTYVTHTEQQNHTIAHAHHKWIFRTILSSGIFELFANSNKLTKKSVFGLRGSVTIQVIPTLFTNLQTF